LSPTKDYFNVNPIREQVFKTVMKYFGHWSLTQMIRFMM
jgi:hypothetical protein